MNQEQFTEIVKSNKGKGHVIDGKETSDIQFRKGWTKIKNFRIYRDRRGLIYNILKYVLLKYPLSFNGIRFATMSSGKGLEETVLFLLNIEAITSFDGSTQDMPTLARRLGRRRTYLRYDRTFYEITDKGRKILKLLYEQSGFLPQNFMRYNLSLEHEEDDTVMYTQLKQI